MHFDQTPVPYDPSIEQPEAGEAETGKAIMETMHKISEITFKDGGHAIRSVHAKSHGVLKGEIEVLADLPPELAQGLFAKPGRYPVVMRLSTTPGDILDDSVTAPRGLAIKVIGVEGERLPGSEGNATQDFVLVNGKTFSAPNAKAFLMNLKLLAATTDKVEGFKKVVSAALRGAEHVVEALGGESATLQALGGHPETHILGDNFFSQVPIRYGDYIAKIAVFPSSPRLSALTDAPLDVNGHPNGLRDSVVAFFAVNEGEWELKVQLCTDLDEMPVENASKVWPEERSPYVTVARITAPPQSAWDEARADQVDDRMAFSPWQGLAAHRPLGSIMRLRRAAYEMSSRFRAEHNHQVVQEPRSFDPPD
jgi:hypothetical protein